MIVSPINEFTNYIQSCEVPIGTPVISRQAIKHTNKNTLWSHFKTTVSENLDLKCTLRNPADIENTVDQINSTSSLEFYSI